MTLKIYRAIKTNVITQKFGENKNPIYKQVGMLGHEGIDFLSYDKEPLYFDCNVKGTVIAICTDINLGYGITIITETDNSIFKHRYWHLKDFNVKINQVVESGDLIGWCDNTGNSTGTHLHRDIKEQILRSGVFNNKYQDNKYFGAISMDDYFVNMFILDLMDNLKQQVSVITKIIGLVKILIGQK